MIILDTVDRLLQVVLAGSVTANHLPIVASYVDLSDTAYEPATNYVLTNNTTAVTIVPAPGAGVKRQIKLISVVNEDTASALVTVQYNDDATLRTIFKATLDVGDQLFYTDGEGWSVIDSSGSRKTGVTGPAGADASPAGTNGRVQFNDNDQFGADGQFSYDKTTDLLSVGNVLLPNGGVVRFTDQSGTLKTELRSNTSTSSATQVLILPTVFPTVGQVASVASISSTEVQIEWADQASGGSGTPAGSDTYVQFNDGGVFGANSGFIYDKTLNKLTITTVSAAELSTGGYGVLFNGLYGQKVRLWTSVDNQATSDDSQDIYFPSSFPAVGQAMVVTSILDTTVTLEWIDGVTPSSTTTLTNKRIPPRVQSVADAATITPSADSNDAVDITAIAQNFTITPQYMMTKQLLARVEWRHDWTTRGTAFERDLGGFTGGDTNTLAAELIYKF